MTGFRIVKAHAESEEDSWEHGITGKYGACWDVQLCGDVRDFVNGFIEMENREWKQYRKDHHGRNDENH